MGPAVFILVAAYSGCDRVQAVVMFTIGMGFMGTFYSGLKVNALDLSPNFAGTVMAIVNGIGGLTGIFVPYLIGVLTDNVSVCYVVDWVEPYCSWYYKNHKFNIYSGKIFAWKD